MRDRYNESAVNVNHAFLWTLLSQNSLHPSPYLRDVIYEWPPSYHEVKTLPTIFSFFPHSVFPGMSILSHSLGD